MVATPYNKKANPVFLVNQTDGQPYTVGTGVADSVTVTGDALTALQAIATAIGTAGDAAGANTVIGQLKQINLNTAA